MQSSKFICNCPNLRCLCKAGCTCKSSKPAPMPEYCMCCTMGKYCKKPYDNIKKQKLDKSGDEIQIKTYTSNGKIIKSNKINIDAKTGEIARMKYNQTNGDSFLDIIRYNTDGKEKDVIDDNDKIPIPGPITKKETDGVNLKYIQKIGNTDNELPIQHDINCDIAIKLENNTKYYSDVYVSDQEEENYIQLYSIYDYTHTIWVKVQYMKNCYKSIYCDNIYNNKCYNFNEPFVHLQEGIWDHNIYGHYKLPNESIMIIKQNNIEFKSDNLYKEFKYVSLNFSKTAKKKNNKSNFIIEIDE